MIEEAPASRTSESLDHTLWAMVALTFVPFLWKGGSYALIGGHTPLIVFLVFATLVSVGALTGGRWARWAIRGWCGGMIAWGAARLLLMALVTMADLSEAHLRSQMTATFAALSVVYVLAGVAIARRA